MLKPILISTLLLPLGVATVGASPVRAETVSKRISYADLDLSSEAGRKRLQSRISWTVRGLCGSRDLSSD
ncbi:MAG TPA: UrcA family protein, partial [Sphingomonas sp.]|nr:UrcA family protein [Sphingomonas sp.]